MIKRVCTSSGSSNPAQNNFAIMNNGEKEFFSLHGHARNNNVEEMIKLLNSRENVNAKDKLHRYVCLS